jgi:hypothetical protein
MPGTRNKQLPDYRNKRKHANYCHKWAETIGDSSDAPVQIHAYSSFVLRCPEDCHHYIPNGLAFLGNAAPVKELLP